METRSSVIFRGSLSFYFIKTTGNRERLGEVEVSRFCPGKYRRIWSFNILGLLTNKIVDVLASTLVCLFLLQVMDRMFYVRVDFYGSVCVCVCTFYFRNTLYFDEIWYQRSAVIIVTGLPF
jgi:hypothetical protein